MEEVTSKVRDVDSTSSPTPNSPHNAPDTAPNENTHELSDDQEDDGEIEPTIINGDGGVAEPPKKRPRLEGSGLLGLSTRAVSPPWKSFTADGPTTVFENGVRKSSRVQIAPPTPEPVKRKSRQSLQSTPYTNGTPKSGGKRGPHYVSTQTYGSKRKAATISGKKTAQALVSPARKSERQRRLGRPPSSNPPSLLISSPQGARRRPGRPRKVPQSSAAHPSDELGEYLANGYDPDAGLYAYADSSAPTPRLRLKFHRPDPPNRHPRHAPPKTKYASLEDWLEQDDPLEGEESYRITSSKARDEAKRRLRIVEAAEYGVLSHERCSIFVPETAPEPSRHYGHWDHVVAHALHFNKLLREEKAYHRKTAKLLAREAYEYWKNKFKRKSQDEIEQEETERQVTRYRQVVKDVKEAWGLVMVEIDNERIARWEEEQLQLGQQAMNDMFNQAQEILGRNVADTASSFASEDREFEGDHGASGSEVSNGGSQRHDDDVMSSSSDSEVENEQDEDAHLTAEQLRAKYEALPDLPDSSSEIEEASDEGEKEADDEDRESQDGTADRTPSPTPDPELDLVNTDELLENSLVQTNGDHAGEGEEGVNYIDPATVELEQVDEALLDSDNENLASESGSEAWSSEDAEEEEGTEEEESDQHEEDGEEESDGEDLGMMGFLASKDIQKLKEAANASIEAEEIEEIQLPIEHTNGQLTPPQDHSGTSVQPHINGYKSTQNDDGAHPSKEVEMINETVVDANFASNVKQDSKTPRSRQTSSPPRTQVPSLLRGVLREYQHDGLDWLANLYESATNGILADEMGLGKTIQTISLLAYLAVRREIWGPHLVVVPTSVMLNWEMEFKKFLPGFKILTYYGDISERKRKRMGWRNMGKDMYNVVITSYQLILQDAAAFKMRAWQYLVLDEAHNIKNFKSQRWQTMLNLRTERRLLLTGTPLQNNIDELWSLLYFLMPAGFAGEGRIAGLEEFTLALKNPTSQILDQGRQQLDAEAQKIVKRLHEVLRPYLLRRLKSEVEKQMPGKYEHVVYCKLSKRQRQLYDGFMGRASTKEILSSGNYMSIINCLMSLRKVCNHPDLFETRAIVTSLAMPKSVVAKFEIKDILVRKRLQEATEEKLNIDALGLLFVRREKMSLGHARRAFQIRATRPLEDLVERQTRRLNKSQEENLSTLQSNIAAMARREQTAVRDHLQTCVNITRTRTRQLPIYGRDIVSAVTVNWLDHTFGAVKEGRRVQRPRPSHALGYQPLQPINSYHSGQSYNHVPIHHRPDERYDYDFVEQYHGTLGFRKPLSTTVSREWNSQQITRFYDMIPTIEQRAELVEPLITRFTCVTPAVAAEEISQLTLSKRGVQLARTSDMAHDMKDPFHASRIRQSIAFPDKRLLQYDCGKLQRLATLLRDLQAGGHRALIFTQMTKVLDILEQFLNIHGHRYLRLDGSTKVEQRQILTDRFNSDNRILCFILSSRSGGLGINLTGADTVIFYDLDWNPAMDKQCQDRAHRIGQTRDVHIYKFVSEYTIEANILRKSNQKRLLDDVIIQKGDFTTDTFNRVTWCDALSEDTGIDTSDEAGAAMERVLGEKAGLLGDARVMNTVEDTEDRNAASLAQKEIVDEIRYDQVDFNESSNATRAASEAGNAKDEELDAEGNEKEMRHVDEYMLGLFRDEFGHEPYRPMGEKQKRNRKGQDPHVRQKKKKYR